MKFGELPVEVQVVAARVLAEKMQSVITKKPAELASEVRSAFIGRYSAAEPVVPQSGKCIVCRVNISGEWGVNAYSDGTLEEAIEMLAQEVFQESEMIAKKIAMSLGFYVNQL